MRLRNRVRRNIGNYHLPGLACPRPSPKALAAGDRSKAKVWCRPACRTGRDLITFWYSSFTRNETPERSPGRYSNFPESQYSHLPGLVPGSLLQEILIKISEFGINGTDQIELPFSPVPLDLSFPMQSFFFVMKFLMVN